MNNSNYTITHKVSKQRLETYGYYSLDVSNRHGYAVNIILDLARANEDTCDDKDYLYPGDILILDWFEKPLEPTETEMLLFQLEYGFSLEFVE